MSISWILTADDGADLKPRGKMDKERTETHSWTASHFNGLQKDQAEHAAPAVKHSGHQIHTHTQYQL